MDTTPPRNVIYANDPDTLTQLVGLPYTDIILAFISPDSNGNLTEPSLNLGDVQALQNTGKNVLISVGGDNDTFPSYVWQQQAQDVPGFVQYIVDYVTANGLNGVDIDYEDDSGFTGAYDGVGFLIDLTNQLAQRLPAGQNIITHAPQPPYFDPQGGFNLPDGTPPYLRILQMAGGNISWFNCQFYNNSSYDEPASNKVGWYGTFAASASPQKLLVGAPVASAAANPGAYLPVDTFASDVIAPLRKQFPGAFGGVMGWEFLYDTDGTWANGVAEALYQQHVFYRGTDKNVHHVVWDPAAGINADQWTFDGSVSSNVAALLDVPQQHVFYVGNDSNIHHVYWDPAAGIHADQWTFDGQAALYSRPAVLLAGGQQHVFYRGNDDNVHHVYWDPTAGINSDQWTFDGSVRYGSSPAVLLAGAQQHVFYWGNDASIRHVYWDPTAGINSDQWTSGGQALSNPAVLLYGAQQHVFYRGADGNIRHVYWDPTAGINSDQWTFDGSVQEATDPAVFVARGQQHVFYVGNDSNVHHVYWDPTAGINSDQWTFDGSVVPDLSALQAAAQQHVFYVGNDSNVHHVYWDPTAGINSDQWTSDGQVASDTATLLTG